MAHQIRNLKCLSSRLTVIFVQSIEARCQVVSVIINPCHNLSWWFNKSCVLKACRYCIYFIIKRINASVFQNFYELQYSFSQHIALWFPWMVRQWLAPYECPTSGGNLPLPVWIHHGICIRVNSGHRWHSSGTLFRDVCKCCTWKWVVAGCVLFGCYAEI